MVGLFKFRNFLTCSFVVLCLVVALPALAQLTDNTPTNTDAGAENVGTEGSNPPFIFAPVNIWTEDEDGGYGFAFFQIGRAGTRSAFFSIFIGPVSEVYLLWIPIFRI